MTGFELNEYNEMLEKEEDNQECNDFGEGKFIIED